MDSRQWYDIADIASVDLILTISYLDTIITSTTEEPDEITNTFLQRVLINLQARNGNTISSIEDIAEYIIATATSLFNAQDIEIDHSDDGTRSPLDIFRETIQHVVSAVVRTAHIGARKANKDIQA